MLLRDVEDPAQVVDARRPVETEPELREFEGDIAADARGDDLVEDVEVGARGCIGLGHARDTLAQQIQCLLEPGRFGDPGGRDRFFHRFAGDEASCEAALAAHAVARGERLQSRTAGDGREKGPGYGLNHQWVRGDLRPPGIRC